jgi:hypothetical protein
LFSIETDFWKQVSAQGFNALLGIATLTIIWKYIKGLSFSDAVKTIIFALIALNPRVISVFTQATNDAIIIFLGNIGLYVTLKLFKAPSFKYAIILIIAVVLGGMSKLNFGIYLIGAVITLVVLAVIHKNFRLSISKGYLGTALCIVVFTGIAAFTFNGYYDNLKRTGKAFTYNTPLIDPPNFFDYEGPYIPGIRTVYSGFFKFYYFDLIKNPRITAETEDNRIKHLTSHWSQIYGRTHFLYFDHWPPQWQTYNPIMIKIGSISLAVAILPTLLFLLGLGYLIVKLLNSLRLKQWDSFKTNDDWVILLFFTGYIMFSVLFSYYGRSYVFMKDIYLFPGLLSVILPLCYGHVLFFKWIKNKMIIKAYYAFVAILTGLYIVPVIDLIIRMFELRAGS